MMMIWSLATIVTLLLGVCALTFTIKRSKQRRKRLFQRAEDELHPLLKNNTVFRSYKTQHAEYSRIRTFYHPHAHKDKHTDIDSLPLLVVVHGLGGILPQFAPILGSLKNIAPCFGLELPGHGQSSFVPDYNAYTIEAFASLWKVAIEDICDQHGHRDVVLIGHSMGCSIAALLISNSSLTPTLSKHISVLGLVATCPKGNSISPTKAKSYRQLLSLPNPVINILRWFDRRGGEYSTSVTRIVGDSTELDLRRTQLGWNRQFQTRVWKRSTLGLLPRCRRDGTWTGGLPDLDVWAGIRAPMLLIAGKSDHVTPTTETNDIFHRLTGHSLQDLETLQSQSRTEARQDSNPLRPVTLRFSNQQNAIQAITLPAPAAHALLYAHSTYRIVAALIEAFLATHVSDHLDFGYQLRLLTTAGKWDVKNLEKWKAVLPVSGPIAVSASSGPNGVFRALKTMREQDNEHNPTTFLQKWSNKIYAVIDISHDAPVYNTKLLDQGGVEYHKFPTVSKVPPTPVEVQDFCSLVDKLIAERDTKAAAATAVADGGHGALWEKRAIAVHCHYGYNRTGFFICSYLILERGFSVQDAIDEFKRAKPPGIRHEHFLDMLWLRYSSVSNPRPPVSGERKMKSEAGIEKLKRKKTSMRTKSELIMTTREDINGEESAKSSTTSLALPALDIDTGAISEGDLM